MTLNHRKRPGPALILLIVAVLIVTLSCSSDSNDSDDNELDSPNQTDYGSPYKVHIKEISNSETNIAFGLIADTHIDQGNCCCGKDNTKRTREVVRDINKDCSHSDCLGVVHLGDLVDGNNTQYVVAFRQIFENDYPGHDGGAIAGCRDTNYDAYSHGDKIKFPVFPTLGNHDIPPFHSGEENWRMAQDYIGDRVIGAHNLLEHYKEVNYVWRWGKYVFFQLGQWAGSYEHEEEGAVDHNKLSWLRAALKKHVGNSGLGVFIFHHYGWDGFSEEKRWWNSDQRERELNVLCRRLNENHPSVPYNIIGIITGHNHDPRHLHVKAGKDLNGQEVIFDNYVMQASGARGGSDEYGFSIVHLDGSQMAMRTKNCNSGLWTDTMKDITLGIVNEPDSFRFSIGDSLNTSGDPAEWHSFERPFSGDTEFGGGVAQGYIDDGDNAGKPDIVLMGIDSRPGAKRFYYRIGFNLSPSENAFDSWSPIRFSPDIGRLTRGAGAAISDIDGNGRPDLVLMYIDAPDGPNQFRYMIGWNLDTEGNAERWSDLIHGPSPGNQSAGGGAEIADIDGNGHPDLLVMDIDDPKGPNQFRYTIAWNLDVEGNPTHWSEIQHAPLSPGDSSDGGGASLADFDGDGSLDLLLMSLDNPDGANTYRYIVGWDLDADGKPESWSDLHYGPSPGSRATGAGASVFIDQDSSEHRLFFMSVDDPLGQE
jgi:hypothetical protein